MQPSFDENFYKDLQSEDELSLVLKAHLHLERSLLDLLRTCLPYPAEIEHRAFRFDHNVMIAKACGLHPDYAKFATSIGRLRNKFAHNLDAKLDRKTVIDMVNALSDEQRIIIENCYKSTRQKLNAGKPEDFTKLDPMSMFQFLVVAIRQAIEAARIQMAQFAEGD